MAPDDDAREALPLLFTGPRIPPALEGLDVKHRAALAWRDKQAAPAQQVEVDPEMQRRLQGLGYTGDDR